MTYEAFLARVIDDGLAAAKADYARPGQLAKYLGSVAGFEACRGKSPQEIRTLLNDANRRANDLAHLLHEVKPAITVDDYWEARCYALEVEWVANVVSAALVSAAMLCGGKTAIPVIITPTTRGMMKAREILGVRR